MSVLPVVVRLAAFAAVLCWAGAVAARRQGWTVAGSALAALALAAEAWRRDADQRWWAVGAAAVTVAAGEAVRVMVDARRRGTHVVVDGAARRSAAVGAVMVLGVVTAAGLAVVALPDRPDPGAGGGVPVVLLPIGVVVLAAGVLAGAVGLGRLGRRRQVAGRSATALAAAVVGLVAATTLVAAAAQARVSWDRAEQDTIGSGSVVATPGDAMPDPTPADEDRPLRPSSSPSRWSWWASVAVMMGFIVVLVVFGRREQLYPPEDLQPDRLVRGGLEPPTLTPTQIEAIDRATVLATVEQALVGLREDTDPRVAVRLAYTTVAQGLGRQELGRRPAETEGEYLTRVFGRLGAGQGPLRRLTELFSLARFSDAPVDEAMRAEALAALEQIRRAVAGGVDAGRTGERS